MREFLGRISILKGCLLEINELNFGLLLPLVVMHGSSACNLPLAIAQSNNVQIFYYALLLDSLAFLVGVCICGRFICRQVEGERFDIHCG